MSTNAYCNLYLPFGGMKNAFKRRKFSFFDRETENEKKKKKGMHMSFFSTFYFY